MDTEQALNPIYNRVNNMFFQPVTDILEETDNSLCDTRHNVAANFFNGIPVGIKQRFGKRLYDIVHNELTNISKSFS